MSELRVSDGRTFRGSKLQRRVVLGQEVQLRCQGRCLGRRTWCCAGSSLYCVLHAIGQVVVMIISATTRSSPHVATITVAQYQAMMSMVPANSKRLVMSCGQPKGCANAEGARLAPTPQPQPCVITKAETARPEKRAAMLLIFKMVRPAGFSAFHPS